MINCVVALDCEARPLLDRFRLRAVETDGGFKLYECDSHERGSEGSGSHGGGSHGGGVPPLRVIVSGTGPVAAGAAVAWLRARRGGRRTDAWINAGIAAHASAPIGTVFLASKIVGAGSGRALYPVFCFRPRVPAATVLTASAPVRECPPETLCDMEAAGFFATATRFATAELVHSIKVVSDRGARPGERPSRARVAELMAGALATIEEVAGELARLVAEVRRVEAPPADLARIEARVRLSVTERRRLERLLRRRDALAPGMALPAEVAEARRGSAVLEGLARLLEGL